MSIYAIGDVQGCYLQLQQLLDKINFNSNNDQLWFAGDIVNRGPDSLTTIRFIKSLGESAITVLGNHDLHLLAMAYNNKPQGKKDTLKDILNAKDKLEILHWLRQRPLMHYEKELDICLVHAGIYPGWSMDQAQKHAHEVEDILRSENYQNFFMHMYGNKPEHWEESLCDEDRLRFITNAFTRMRFCDENYNLSLKYKGDIGSQPENLHPWFSFNNKTINTKILFGHWSTLKNQNTINAYPLDTGCLWGGSLTALKVDKNLNQYFTIDCPSSAAID